MRSLHGYKIRAWKFWRYWKTQRVCNIIAEVQSQLIKIIRKIIDNAKRKPLIPDRYFEQKTLQPKQQAPKIFKTQRIQNQKFNTIKNSKQTQKINTKHFTITRSVEQKPPLPIHQNPHFFNHQTHFETQNPTTIFLKSLPIWVSNFQ